MTIYFPSYFSISIVVASGFLLPAYSQIPYLNNSQSSDNQGSDISSGSSTKYVIINFDDSDINQFRYAKPILDRYGFRATFFEVCGWLHSHEAWQTIAALKADGMDVESHTMTHKSLNKMSTAQLEYEIGQSKQCFLSHGMNTTIFAYPYGEGSNNSTVINIVAKYYDLARGARYAEDEISTFGNRYSINSWAPIHIGGTYINGSCTGTCSMYDNSQMFDRFVKFVNIENNYNEDAKIKMIPIVVYHTIVTYPDVIYSKRPVDTTVNLFEKEMRYLHDNGFSVLTMTDIGYDENMDSLYVKK